MVILTEDTNDLLYRKLYLSPCVLLLLVSHYQCSYVYHRLEDCKLVPRIFVDRIQTGCFQKGNVFQDNLKADGEQLALVL